MDNPKNDREMLLQSVEQVNVKDRIKTVLRYWPLFLICLGLAFACAYFYQKVTTPIYSASASVMIKDDKKGPSLINSTMLNEIGIGANNKLVENEIEILKSYDLMESVVRDLNLNLKISKKTSFVDKEIQSIDAPFVTRRIDANKKEFAGKWEIITDGAKLVVKRGSNTDTVLQNERKIIDSVFEIAYNIMPQAGVDFTEFEESAVYYVEYDKTINTVKKYSDRLSVDAVNKMATVINLEMTDPIQERAVTILESLIETYNRNSLSDKNKMSDNTVKFLDTRLMTVAQELRGVENNVEKFKSQNKVTNLATDAEQYLAASEEVDMKKAVSQTQLNIINALENNLLENQNNPQLVPSTLGIQEPTLETLIEKHNSLMLQKERIVLKSGPKNPLLLDLEQQVREIRTRLLENVKNLKASYQISLSDISSKDEQLNSRIKNVPILEKKLLQITRNKNVLEELYTFLLQKREEASISRASNIEDSRIVTRARESKQVAPKKSIIWGTALMLGLLIPFIIMTIKETFYDKVGDVDEVESQTGMSVLGTLSHTKKGAGLVDNPRSKSILAEQIRHLRTSISHTSASNHIQTILVSSFQPGEGKTFVSSNLGASFALLRKKTIVLELDLRKPGLTESLNLEPTPGISEIIEGTADLNDLIVEVPQFNGYYHLLTAGGLTSNPSEIISSHAMALLIAQLKSMYEVIIIDTPPMSLVTDATLLQKYADTSILVLRQGYSFTRVYKELNQRRQRFAEYPLNIVLNGYGKSRKYENKYAKMGYNKGYYSAKA
ncbi:GumC family protein [Flavitalea antarctica]